MTFDQLNEEHGVKVLWHRNSYGLVDVGRFTTFAAAEAYVAEARQIEGCEFPPNISPVWPPRESNPEMQYMNDREDRRADFHVHVRVPAIAKMR